MTNAMTALTINIELAEQIRDILAAFAAASAPVSCIEYPDDETIHVFTTDERHFAFEITSDDDALTFVNVADDRDIVTVEIPAE